MVSKAIFLDCLKSSNNNNDETHHRSKRETSPSSFRPLSVCKVSPRIYMGQPCRPSRVSGTHGQIFCNGGQEHGSQPPGVVKGGPLRRHSKSRCAHPQPEDGEKSMWRTIPSRGGGKTPCALLVFLKDRVGGVRLRRLVDPPSSRWR